MIEKILKIATRTNKKELESFRRLVNFYKRFVPKYTDLTEPFANLRTKNVEFISSEKQKKSFDRLKVIMAKKLVVKMFDPTKDITLTTDASEHSISGKLSQEGNPIMYLSGKLKNTEFNYSIIEKETFAIVWTTSRAWVFNWEKIILRSDHTPLEFIFNPRKELLKVTREY